MSRLMKTLVLTMVCGGLAALPATAQTPGELQAQIDTLQAHITTLQGRMSAVEGDMPDCMTTASGAGSVDDVIFAGCNVHVRNGQGSTASSNSVGNLIVGYNESGGGSPARGGSHNVVIGPEHSYSSYGGLVAGYQNTVSGAYASVSGGRFNEASGARQYCQRQRRSEQRGQRRICQRQRRRYQHGQRRLCQRQRR